MKLPTCEKALESVSLFRGMYSSDACAGVQSLLMRVNSIWGHWAGGPGQSTEDVKWLDKKLHEFFSNNGAIPMR